MKKKSYQVFFSLCLVCFLFLSGCSPADIHINASYNHLVNNNLDKALLEANRAITADPHNALGYNNKSAALSQKGIYFEALSAADKAISLNYSLGLAHLNKGRCLYFLGRYDEAIVELETASSGSGLNSASKQMISDLTKMCHTEKLAESNFTRTEPEMIKKAKSGEPVINLKSKPVSANDPNWKFNTILYIQNMAPFEYLTLDNSAFMNQWGGSGYRIVETDYGYDFSYRLVTPAGEMLSSGNYYIDLENNSFESYEQINYLGRTINGTTEGHIEEYGDGILVKMNLTLPCSILTSFSAISEQQCNYYKSYIIWLENNTNHKYLSHNNKSFETENSPEHQSIVTGTGFSVSSDGHIVTAYHVVKGGNNIQVKFRKGEWISANVIQKSPINDVAILKVEQSTENYLHFASEVNLGQKIFTLGYPVPDLLGESPKYSDGTVSSLSGLADEASWMQVSVSLQPGNSGGPIIDENGCVVGMAASVAEVESFYNITGTLPQNVNWAVKSDFILPLLPKKYRQTCSDNFSISKPIDDAEKAICIVKVKQNFE
jgi:S1-C subfamily serine protease/tetratricopeptide (TPR) repeat protein